MHYEKAVVPVDLSPGSLAVLQEAVGLAPFGVKEVAAVHLFDVTGVESPVARTMEQEAQSAIEKAVGGVETGEAGTLSAVARCGVTAECFLKTASELGGDLIVLGSTGKKPVEELLFGSLSEQVAREATVPVLFFRFPLVVDEKPERLLQLAGSVADTVLHPTDFSASSGRALDVALDTQPERLILVHVVDDSSRAATNVDALVEEATSRLKTIKRRIKRSGLEIEVGVGVGDPAASVLKTTQDEGVTMIAVGSRGRGLMTETILGGVSMDIMRSARVPILVVR